MLVDKANQIVGLAQAFGEDFTADVKSMDDGQGGQVQYLDPRAIVEWLKAHDGAIVRMQLKIRRQKDQPAQNEIDYFMPVESNSAFDADTGEVLENDAAAADEAVEDDLPPSPRKPATNQRPVAQRPVAHVTKNVAKNGTRQGARR